MIKLLKIVEHYTLESFQEGMERDILVQIDQDTNKFIPAKDKNLIKGVYLGEGAMLVWGETSVKRGDRWSG